MARSAMCWFSRTEPDCLSNWSTKVVLPWSTWAMMAMLRICMNQFCWGSGGFIEGCRSLAKETLPCGPRQIFLSYFKCLVDPGGFGRSGQRPVQIRHSFYYVIFFIFNGLAHGRRVAVTIFGPEFGTTVRKFWPNNKAGQEKQRQAAQSWQCQDEQWQ